MASVGDKQRSDKIALANHKMDALEQASIASPAALISRTIEELENPDGADQLKADLITNGVAAVVLQEHLILRIDERDFQIEKSLSIFDHARAIQNKAA